VGYLIYFVFPSQLSFICWFIMTLIFLSFWTSRFHSPIAPLCIPSCNYDRGSNQKISESPGLLIAVQPFTSLDSSGRSYGMPTNTWSLSRSGSFSESLTLPPQYWMLWVFVSIVQMEEFNSFFSKQCWSWYACSRSISTKTTLQMLMWGTSSLHQFFFAFQIV
jgi:hypothetical protein